MSACDNFIEKVEQKLPEQCSVEDLVKVGIYRSPQAAAHSRTSGDAPSYFKLGRRIMYPRDAVIEWLKGKKHENSTSYLENKIESFIPNLPKQTRMACNRRS